MERLQSVDTLRGMTIIAMILVNNPGTWSHVYAPLLHAEWHGLTPTDLIFPFFLFIVGISIALAYNNKKPSSNTYKKIAIRSLKLIGLGLLINVFTPIFPFIQDLNSVRIPGVLQRIGIVFFISSILFLNFNYKSILAFIILILGFYFLVMCYLPLNGSLPSLENNLNNWANFIDYQILGNHTWQKNFDPEGIFSTLPSIATSLTGILIGKILTQNKQQNKTFILIIIACLLLLLGYIWSIWFPINKALWTSSFVLVTAGWATAILSVTYYFNDIKKRNLTPLFSYVSRNAITLYFLSMMITKSFYIIKINQTENVHGWLFNHLTFFISQPELASLVYALADVAFYLFLSYYLFKKKIFFKV